VNGPASNGDLEVGVSNGRTAGSLDAGDSAETAIFAGVLDDVAAGAADAPWRTAGPREAAADDPAGLWEDWARASGTASSRKAAATAVVRMAHGYSTPFAPPLRPDISYD